MTDINAGGQALSRARRIAEKFLALLLINDQRNRWVEICTELREPVANGPNFLSKINRGDEMWVYGYDLETKQ